MIKLMLKASSLRGDNMELKVIKSKKQYQEYLNWVDSMFDKMVPPNTQDGEKVQVALVLIKQTTLFQCQIPLKQ